MAAPLPRSALLALAAVVVPAAIVAGLGYLSLRQWQTSAELLFREQARDMASMAVDKIEMVVRQADDEILSRVEHALGAPDRRQALDRLRAETPLLQSLVLLDRAGRALYPSGPGEDEALARAVPAAVVQGLWERGGRRHFVTDEQPGLAAILRGPAGAPVLAAFTRRPDALHAVFDSTIKPLEALTICAIVDERGRTIYSKEPLEHAELIAAVPFREGFPRWRIALYQPEGPSPRQAVQRQVAIFTAAFGVLFLVVVAGLVATYRLVRRETEMARLKADFVANVSHDLKTPLSVIRMFGETLEMGRLPDEAARQEYYHVITRETERLTRLIDNVLDFSRIESGRRTYVPVPTAVEPLVRESVEGFSVPLAQQGFKVEVQVAPDLPEVPLDADAVAQALANLVDNAIKYSAERKSLRVEARAAEGHLVLEVADEGIGIPREEQSRIFDKFYRVGRSETQGRRGSGVGLALVRHVAEAHGGRVTVESRPGEGSRFTLWFPLA
ncbi:MAG TPA: HAMP domain-containing sensor histidine kinase [Methylomirabilota bacterium]|nr:HAMP domain-containing sensor histidine kinase [Methylomirabilota bacterium]